MAQLTTGEHQLLRSKRSVLGGSPGFGEKQRGFVWSLERVGDVGGVKRFLGVGEGMGESGKNVLV